MLRRLAPTLAFSGTIAAIVILIGPSDLESYDTAFFSLDRGTAVEAVHVLGHPVYTLSLGLGLRLPLHGSLGASPAAALSPYVPMPVTYGLLLVCAIASAVLIVKHALQPMCGRLVAWLAIGHLFLSLPIVTYTIAADWPEIVVAYIAIVACVFAPHAFLATRDPAASSAARLVMWLSIAGVIWSLVAVAHSGYWPHIAATLVCSTMLALCRWDHPLGARLAAVATLALASIGPVALQAPDILRELSLAGTQGIRRFVQGPTGNVVLANLFPFGQVGPRMPFTNLLLAGISLAIGLRSTDTRDRWLIVGSAIVSIALGIGASMLTPGSAAYAPSNTWAIRDYAGAFAVLSGACAAGAVMRRPARHAFMGGPLLLMLALAAVQGPLYARRVAAHEMASGGDPGWTRDLRSADSRIGARGLPRDRVSPGSRIALWPEIRGRMRGNRENLADFADGGYELVTAAVKDRTMRRLIEPNDLLFNQSTDLSSEILCDARAASFLQLRLLLTPSGVMCPPWRSVPDSRVDGWLEVRESALDDEVRAIPVAQLTDTIAREPALSARSSLIATLVPLKGTSLRVGPRDIVMQQDDVTRSTDRAIVLPVAYDSAWTTSSGQVRSIGGLLAVVNIDQPRVTLRFAPDAIAILLALGMTIAQLLAVAGILGLASVRPADSRDATLRAREHVIADFVGEWRRRASNVMVRALAVARPLLRDPVTLLCLAYSAAVIARVPWRPQRADETSLLSALLLPIMTIAVARAARWQWLRNGIGVALLAVALVRVGINGSRAAEALHDPLFWGIVSVILVALALFSRRWPAIAVMASVLAGAATATASVLPNLPNFDEAYPAIDVSVVSRSLTGLSDRLGFVATALLMVLWVYAIAVTWRGRRGDRVPAGACGALLAALILCLLGSSSLLPAGSWMAALGALLGIAGTHGDHAMMDSVSNDERRTRSRARL